MRVRRLGAAGFLVAVVALLLVPAASAQTYTGVPPPSLGPALTGSPGGGNQSTAAPRALAPRVVSSASVGATQVRVGGLALTGTDVVTLLAAGTCLVLLGTAFSVSARRRLPRA
jgi:hypothetical protein